MHMMVCSQYYDIFPIISLLENRNIYAYGITNCNTFIMIPIVLPIRSSTIQLLVGGFCYLWTDQTSYFPWFSLFVLS